MNRKTLFSFVESVYGSRPEYLWKSSPEAAVLRHKENRKWFAIVMRVPACKIGLEGSKSVDIVNVKCDPLMVGSLLMCSGIFPAYHMNKENWISILLGSSSDEEQIISLIENSYEITLNKAKAK